jgi:purine nucleoside phosphorylase
LFAGRQVVYQAGLTSSNPSDAAASAGQAAAALAAESGVARHDVAVMLGSGWAAMANALGAGVSAVPLSAEDVLLAGRAAQPRLAALLATVLDRLEP